MKKFSIFLCFVFLLSTFSLSISSCSRKTGCPAFGTKTTAREKRKGGKSNLFDKQTRRKLGSKYEFKTLEPIPYAEEVGLCE